VVGYAYEIPDHGSKRRQKPFYSGKAHMTTFTQFFRDATRSDADPNGRNPYPFQNRFAEANHLCHLVRAPTGSGKTATAVIGWLWRWQSKKPDTPRRLVYCLPMRVLVEQSEQEAHRWIANLKLDIPVHILMGGVESDDWYLDPDRPAVLIGTQDMLLSRALNRGYAASRFHWPIDFGLLNNDCLWVFDEPQLMAGGVSTSAQLAGLRKSLMTFGPCPSVWMSATLEPEWLDTIDYKDRSPGAPLELTDDDYDPKGPLFKRMTAKKTLSALGVPSSNDMKAVAKAVLERHVPGTQTLVVLNTVDRAKAVHVGIDTIRGKSPTPTLLLVHSRFRPAERQQLNRQLKDQGDAANDRIIVATQVVEAGVDISGRTLVTELGPWASMVQRIGRCNRTGADGPGNVFWIDLEEKLSLPYTASDLDFARAQLKKLDGKSVSPKDLDAFKKRERISLPFEHKHVLRRRDLLDLFDTAPDLSGNDIDVQRFVRGDDSDLDVQVFWRDIPEGGPNRDEPSPQRQELCGVPVTSFGRFLAARKHAAGYIWDHLDEEWVKVDPKQLRPGMAILFPATVGGYSDLGWDSSGTEPVKPCLFAKNIEKAVEEAIDSDPHSMMSAAATIAEHSEHVCTEMCKLLKAITALPGDWSSLMEKAARWHDVGKSHPVFQLGIRTTNPTLDVKNCWAKSGTNGRLRYERKHFRHELASALAALQQDLPFGVAYLSAAHHGRARLAIRALPGEDQPAAPDTPFALGVHQGDMLPEVDLGQGETCPATVLDLSPMLLGADRSWTAGALKLLAELGPFRLAYLETLLRAADVRASRKEANHA
jgi:CRISPR-associated endonuclease/helicase Cas3